MLAAMRANAARRGFAEFVAPVRPNGKVDIREPMSTYAFRLRETGPVVVPQALAPVHCDVEHGVAACPDR